MSILKDYIAYARIYIEPKLSEEASQRLIQAYVGKNNCSILVSSRSSGVASPMIR